MIFVPIHIAFERLRAGLAALRPDAIEVLELNIMISLSLLRKVLTMTASYQPNQSLRFLCEAKKSRIKPYVFCESMIHTHGTYPITICYTQYNSALRLTKAAQKYHAQQEMGSSRGRSQ
jgi:hypothetical protein